MDSRVEHLFQGALDRAEHERAAYLTEMCGGDEALRQEVESLLCHDQQAGSGFLESPPVQLVEGAIRAEPSGSAPAELRMIGPYQLIRKLGEGGMGQVWLAQQAVPLRRQVALKLIRAGCGDDSLLRRFESERQSLAMMDHPAIAKVFDAGATTEGQPYFVMEYVEGWPIDTYCDEKKLTIRERLKLFMRVCEGVQHAHQKAIIHRDLKPSNILVAEVDGRPAPKIIDFGVAKALSQKLTADTLFTRAGVLIGTPQYMSPEQASSAGEDIDTRTDVYSLGIILYELLAGAPPLELRQIAFEEFLRRLREDEPPKPSTKIRTQDPAASTEIARKRQTEPAALVKQVRGDLDSIALKALEKDRPRRYGSPSDFAVDIGRYLRHEAVVAVAPSAAYRARKFARRHRGALVTAVAFVVVLIAAAAVSIGQSVRANREAAVAQAVNDFLQNDLLAQASAANQSGPKAKPDPDLKVRTALDRAAARITGKFAKQPEVEAAVRNTIGHTYADLGLYPAAHKQFERSLDLCSRLLGPENPRTLRTMDSLGSIAQLQGDYAEAERLLGQTLEVQRRVLGSQHPDTLTSMNNLATVYFQRGKYARAEALDRQILEIRRRVLGPEHHDTLATANNLAIIYAVQGEYVAAEPLLSQILEIERRVLGPEHPMTLTCMTNLANADFWLGKYERAVVLYQQATDIRYRILGPKHPDTLMSMTNLALGYGGLGKYAEAEKLGRQAMETKRVVLGPEHASTLRSMDDVACFYTMQGKYSEAEALLVRTLGIQRRVLSPTHPDTLTCMKDLAYVYYLQSRYAQAEALLTKTLELVRAVLGAEYPDALDCLAHFSDMYQRQGEYGLAETYAKQALAARRHAFGSEHSDTMASAADLALAYLSQGEFANGEPPAHEALEFFTKNRPDDWQRFRAESLLGASLAGQKKYAEAELLLLAGYQGMLARKDRIGVPDRYHLDRAHEWVVQLYQAWGKPAKAAEWRRK